MIKLLKIPVLEVRQKKVTFYSGVINSKEFANAVTVVPRSEDPKKGIQRILNSQRVKSIAEFVRKENGIIFPNSIILNCSKETIYKNGELIVPDKKDSILLIDGQHRFEGVVKSGVNMPLIVTFFIGLPVKDQAKIFLKINSTQKGINTSLVYDLFHLTRSGENVDMIAVDLVYKLNEENGSPWFGMIKTNDARTKKEATNSASFIAPLKKILKSRDGIFSNLDFQHQYVILENYFNAIKNLFPDQWGNKQYILTKGVGVSVFLKLLPYILVKCFVVQDNLCEKVGDILQPLSSYKFTSKDYGGFSSEAGFEKLVDILKSELEK